MNTYVYSGGEDIPIECDGTSIPNNFAAQAYVVNYFLKPALLNSLDITFVNYYEAINESKSSCVGKWTFCITGITDFYLYISVECTSSVTNSNELYIGICKTDDIENTSYINRMPTYMRTSCHKTDSAKNIYQYYLRDSLYIRTIISEEGIRHIGVNNTYSTETKCFVIGKDAEDFKYCAMLYGTSIYGVYYDSSQKYTIFTGITSDTYTNEKTILVSDVIIVYDTTIKSITKDLKIFINTQVGTNSNTSYQLIDVEGTHYRQIYGYYWVMDDG